MNLTSIEWTHRPGTTGMTWNPIRSRRKSTGKTGTFCTRISPGCKHCYASTINKRFGTGAEYEVPDLEDHEFFIDERILNEPLKRKKPATIFVGDMFDLFHEAISLQEGNDDPLTGPNVARVFDVMVRCPQHTFQLLTKRAENMKLFMECADNAEYRKDFPGVPFPPPNIWFGTSVESQKYADERIPLLLQTPAAVRFLSVEPLLEKVDLQTNRNYLKGIQDGYQPPIDWVIVGGESGPGARPFNLSWAESLLKQCKAAEVPFFMKQLGSVPTWPEKNIAVMIPADRKGGDMSEWPEHLRVREFPV